MKTERAWKGKLSGLDSILAWAYDQNILTKTDKNEKDRIFRAYYSWHNDGDFPLIVRKMGLNKWSPRKDVSTAIETVLEEFLRKMIRKYKSKINRSEFYFDQFQKNVEDIEFYVVGMGPRSSSSFAYWSQMTALCRLDPAIDFIYENQLKVATWELEDTIQAECDKIGIEVPNLFFRPLLKKLKKEHGIDLDKEYKFLKRQYRKLIAVAKARGYANRTDYDRI